MKGKSWIGVDLDGTLATYDKWVNWNIFGEPIKPMVDRIKIWIKEGKEVKIFTARVAFDTDICVLSGEKFTKQMMTEAIQNWCSEVIPNWRPEITATKDFNMIELWDDRAIQVIPNTGISLAEAHLAEKIALTGKP